MSARIEAIAAFFASGIAVYLVYGTDISASNTGFALEMASGSFTEAVLKLSDVSTVGFCHLLRWLIVASSWIEVQANSLERIQQYLTIEHEPEATPSGVPPAYWPSSGKLSVEALSARYSVDGPKVLHDLDFTINAGERVGIGKWLRAQ